MSLLRLGVLGRSRKEDERRLPLHPRHLDRIPDDLAGASTSNAATASGSASPTTSWPVAWPACGAASSSSRRATSSCCPSRCSATSPSCGDGQVLWGWPHCVQDDEITQVAIDRRLTLIAFEAMNHWNSDGSFSLHVFHKNNELAGYCSVLHAMQLAGLDRQLRPPAARRRHRLRGDRPGCGDGAHRAGRPRRRRPHPPRRSPPSPRRSTRPGSCSSTTTTTPGEVSHAVTEKGRVPLARVPRRARHHRQLRAPGHRRPADLPDRRRPRPCLASAP